MAHAMEDVRRKSSTNFKEEERLNPGSERNRVPQPQPARRRQRNKAALGGSQNEDLKGPKPGRGPRGGST